MKKLIRLNALLISLLMTVVFSSCLDFGDDDAVTYYYKIMADVHTGGTKPVFIMDNGDTLTSLTSVPADTFQAGERYYLVYAYGDTTHHDVRNYMINISSYGKSILREMKVWPKDSTDVWGNAPLLDYGLWVSNHYFNVYCKTFASLDAVNTMEFIRKKDKESALTTDTAPTLYFELRHNTPTSSLLTDINIIRLQSFNLRSLKTEFPAAVKIQLTVNWNYRTLTKNFSFTYLPKEPSYGSLVASGSFLRNDGPFVLSPTPL